MTETFNKKMILATATLAAAAGGFAINETAASADDVTTNAAWRSKTVDEVKEVVASAGTDYTVQAGDTVSVIAEATGLTVDDIVNANGLNDANFIVAGEKLVLSEGAVASSVATSSVAASSVAPAASSVAASVAPVSSVASSVAPAQQASTPSVDNNYSNSSSSVAVSGNWQQIAMSLQGVPYVWGGKTPSGFDCSGFVSYVFAQAGIANLTPYTVTMANQVNISAYGSTSLNPGDLLFWGARGSEYHVGIYLGNNQYIAAPKPGDVVKVSTIYSSWAPSEVGKLR